MNLRIVLVGCGAMSREWLRVATQTPELEIVGLCDLIEDAARARQSEFNLEHSQIGSDLGAMLESLHPDILFDCTLPEAHFKNAMLAFIHGVHVLSEKPLADSREHALELTRAAHERGVIHAVIQNRRFDTNIRRVRTHLESGAIGAITTLNADFYIGAHFEGFRNTMEHPLLLDMAIHTFDAARLILGANAVSVYAHTWNPAGSWYAQNASAMCIFEMSDGSVFNYRGSWCSEGFPTSWQSEWRVIGTQGTIRWDGETGARASVPSNQGQFMNDNLETDLPTLENVTDATGHQRLIQDFVRHVRNGTSPETVASDNIHSLEMVFAAIESARTGQKITLESVNQTRG
jgi:predicted dehydrogenase